MAEAKSKSVPTGAVEFTYSMDHGSREKEEVVIMHKSTAKALEMHKIGKITKVITRLEKAKK